MLSMDCNSQGTGETINLKKSKAEKRSERLQHAKATRADHKTQERCEQDKILMNMMEELSFNLFGSHDGNDLDILVRVSKKITLLRYDQVDRICALYSNKLSESFIGHNIDVNLVYLENDIIIWTAHGTVWETTNALFSQYQSHKQYHPCFVKAAVIPTQTEINTKIHRAVRNVLSMYTRSVEHREIVKRAMCHKSTLGYRLNTINTIISSQNTWADNRTNIVKINIQLKRACYQALQALCVMKSTELYSKSDLSSYCPDVRVFLYREIPTENDFANLHKLFNDLLKTVIKRAEMKLIDLSETEVN